MKILTLHALAVNLLRASRKHITPKPHSRVEVKTASPHLRGQVRMGSKRDACSALENDGMATRERRLAEFNGEGAPPPDQPVQVLCEDHSGTYQLPFACRFVNGAWLNDESGRPLEATVVGWRLKRH
jgi:hypothetical protein